MVQDTRYPWDGRVKISVDPGEPAPFAINVRIPGWARNDAVPSDLYHLVRDAAPSQSIEWQTGADPVGQRGASYVALRRQWKAGDVIALDLPMPVRRIVANSQVAADRGRVAIQRGPIVFAAEGVDNPDHKVRTSCCPMTRS